jgi:hypothetical protein
MSFDVIKETRHGGQEQTKAMLSTGFLSWFLAMIASSPASMRRSNAARRARKFSKRSARPSIGGRVAKYANHALGAFDLLSGANAPQT